MKATTYRIILILSGFAYLYIVIVSAILTYWKENTLWDFGQWEVFLLVFTILHYILTHWLFTRYRRACLYETHDLFIFGQITETIVLSEADKEHIEEKPADTGIKADDAPGDDNTLQPSYEEAYMSEEFFKKMTDTGTTSGRPSKTIRFKR